MSGLLIQASCGCIAFSVQRSDGMYLVVRCCDADRNEPDLGLFWRDLEGEGKTFSPITEELANELINKLANLISDGHNMWDIRQLLRPR